MQTSSIHDKSYTLKKLKYLGPCKEIKWLGNPLIFSPIEMIALSTNLKGHGYLPLYMAIAGKNQYLGVLPRNRLQFTLKVV